MKLQKTRKKKNLKAVRKKERKKKAKPLKVYYLD